jgi:hypothetical protein
MSAQISTSAAYHVDALRTGVDRLAAALETARRSKQPERGEMAARIRSRR